MLLLADELFSFCSDSGLAESDDFGTSDVEDDGLLGDDDGDEELGGVEDVDESGDKQAELGDERLAKYDDEVAEQEDEADDAFEEVSFILERSSVEEASIWFSIEEFTFTALGSTSQEGVKPFAGIVMRGVSIAPRLACWLLTTDSTMLFIIFPKSRFEGIDCENGNTLAVPEALGLVR